LALAALLYLSRPEPEDLKTWAPVSHPIPPAPGRVEIPPFTAAEDRTFQLFLYGKSDSKTCPESAIDWAILRNGKAEASGSSKADQLSFSDNAIACWIAEFNAQKGDRYGVSLNVHKVALTNAKLLVQTYPNVWLDAYYGKEFFRLFDTVASALLALAAVTLLLVVSLLKRVLD
jgi:hypothetical protein